MRGVSFGALVLLAAGLSSLGCRGYCERVYGSPPAGYPATYQGCYPQNCQPQQCVPTNYCVPYNAPVTGNAGYPAQGGGWQAAGCTCH